MSSVYLLIIGLLLFAATNGDDTQQKDISLRNRRSLTNMYTMWTELTGTEGTKFVNYGNYCGLGGSGTPVDPLDGCCQSHDLCYEEVELSACQQEGEKALYGKNYNYKIENERATCDKNDDTCATSLCLCDVVLNNCVKSNLHLYNPEYYHQVSISEAMMQGNYLKNIL
uniref:Phospholipase A2 n=1 Tax=Parasteatoda tepidariorum TaxID=114398 RepID=A0A2L2Y6H2_PARTP